MRYVSKIFVALYPVVNISLLALKNELLFVANGRGSAVYRALDGSIYPSYKLVPSSLAKKCLVVKKCNNLYLGLVKPSSG